MSTGTLKALLVHRIQCADALPPVDAVRLLLALEGMTISDLARCAGVTRQAVYPDIRGRKPSAKVRAAAEEIFGCVPWHDDQSTPGAS